VVGSQGPKYQTNPGKPQHKWTATASHQKLQEKFPFHTLNEEAGARIPFPKACFGQQQTHRNRNKRSSMTTIHVKWRIIKNLGFRNQ